MASRGDSSSLELNADTTSRVDLSLEVGALEEDDLLVGCGDVAELVAADVEGAAGRA